MNRVRFTVAALGLALLGRGAAGRADDEKPQRPGAARQRQGQDRQRPGLGAALGRTPLLTKEEAEKLKLTNDQKPKVEKIVSAFNTKLSEGMDKLREAMQKARDNGDQDAMREVMEKARAMMQDTEKARESAEAKVKELLTDEQQKTFDDLKKDRPARPGFGGRGPGGQGFPGGGRFGGGFPGGFTPGQVLPSAVQDRLELSKEQKEQLQKLQKEVDEKLQKILNDEQKKKLDDLKNGRRGGAGRPRRPGTPRSDLD
jgi:Spy/CpxP family protein refolding chaperone